MRILGFEDAKATRGGVDGGADVESEFGLAQVKHYQSGTIGAPAVQQLRGVAYKVRWPLFYTSFGYTTAAHRFADEAGVALFIYNEAGGATAESEAAVYLVEHGITRASPKKATPPMREFVAALQRFVQGEIGAAGITMAEFITAVGQGSRAVGPDELRLTRARLDLLVGNLGGTEVRSLPDVLMTVMEMDAIVSNVAFKLGLSDDVVYANWIEDARPVARESSSIAPTNGDVVPKDRTPAVDSGGFIDLRGQRLI